MSVPPLHFTLFRVRVWNQNLPVRSGWVLKVKYNSKDNITISSLSSELDWSRLNANMFPMLSLKLAVSLTETVTIAVTTAVRGK